MGELPQIKCGRVVTCNLKNSEKKERGRAKTRADNVCAKFVLFSSQCCYRIDASSAVGREEAGKEGRTCEHQSCGNKRQRIARSYVIQDLGEDAPCGQ